MGTSRTSPACTSPAPHLHLACISPVSHLHLACISRCEYDDDDMAADGAAPRSRTHSRLHATDLLLTRLGPCRDADAPRDAFEVFAKRHQPRTSMRFAAEQEDTLRTEAEMETLASSVDAISQWAPASSTPGEKVRIWGTKDP